MSWICQACHKLTGVKFFPTRLFATIMASNIAKFVDLTAENVKEMVPKMTFDLHKGQCGRIGVIGGSKEYDMNKTIFQVHRKIIVAGTPELLQPQTSTKPSNSKLSITQNMLTKWL